MRYTCCDCGKAIYNDDGAMLCTKCGGRNTRILPCDRVNFMDEGWCDCGAKIDDHALGFDFWFPVCVFIYIPVAIISVSFLLARVFN